MSPSRSSVVLASTCAAGLAAVLLVSGAGTAGAKPGPGPNRHDASSRVVHASADKAVTTGYVQVDHMSFVPDSNGSADAYFVNWTGGLTSTTSNCFNAGFSVPNGAKLTSVRVFGTSGPNSDLFVRVLRHNQSNGNGADVAGASVANDSGSFFGATIPVTSAAVGSSQFSYGIGVCVGSDTVFNGARVNYTK